MFPAGAGQQVRLGTSQLDRGREYLHPVVGVEPDLAGVEALRQNVVDGELEVLRVDAQGERQAGLRVEIDQQHTLPQLGERRTERGDRRGLGDATLLVGDRERCPSHWLHHARRGCDPPMGT